jgi:hypothetical protein
MEKIKTILDREPISSQYIGSKQDFANVLDGAKGLGKPYWKSTWFYGTVGVTAVAIIVAAVTLTNSDDPLKNPKVDLTASAALSETSIGDDTPEEVPADNAVEFTEDGLEEGTDVVTSAAPEEIIEERPAARIVELAETDQQSANLMRTAKPQEEPEEVEIGLPNVAGVSKGPISFKDFCDPLGIQVGNGILIHQYTIQYRSCARDVSARVRGNRLPNGVCDEIQDCGAPIEVTFSNFKAEDRNGNTVDLKPFSLVTRPK